MEKNQVLKLIYSLVLFPFIMLLKNPAFLRICNLSRDLERCVETVDSCKEHVPAVLIEALVVAEDHRNDIHPGVDLIGIARALLVRIVKGEIQGASTIEQQFVRVVTSSYERTISRKIREQALAIALTQCRSKTRIATAYLSAAYFGSDCVGIRKLERQLALDLSDIDWNEALICVAYLKYPRPPTLTPGWFVRVSCRAAHLSNKSRHMTNVFPNHLQISCRHSV